MSDTDTGRRTADADEPAVGDKPTAGTVDEPSEAQPDGNTDIPADGDTFPREYVETLRKESAEHETNAEAAKDRADALAKRLHTELVRATGRLENAADLPFDTDHLDDDDALSAAIDALLSDRPYFAKRKVVGDAGQGARGGNPEPFSLLDALKGKR